MAKEIELKFLVTSRDYQLEAVSRREITQGYISRNPSGTVRVRITGDNAFLTVKGANTGIVRDEWEYSIPVKDAREMLTTVCDSNVISKERFIVDHDGLRWEIDEFHGRLEGLTVAEVELPGVDAMPATLPSWIGRNVTGDIRYYNSNLTADNPIPPVE